jgi:hypothetical protein
MIGAVSVAALTLSVAAFAQKPEFGTAAEAKAMLERAIPLVKADKAAAIAKFIKGEDGFKDRDLYVFCFNSGDGKINAAPPAVLGKDARTLVDKAGDNYGKRIYEQANAKAEGVRVAYPPQVSAVPAAAGGLSHLPAVPQTL